MGGGSGGGIRDSGGSLQANITGLGREFPLSANGKIGLPGKSSRVRVVHTQDPRKTAERLYEKLKSGSVFSSKLQRNKGHMSRFANGDTVIYRPTSKSGSPAITLTFSGTERDYKIHFEPKVQQ